MGAAILKFIVLLSLVLLTSISANADHSKKTGILVVGDSWAMLMCQNNSLIRVLNEFGFNKNKFFSRSRNNAVSIHGCQYDSNGTTQIGATTKDWLKKFSKIKKQLLVNPNIKFVILSLGGNDFWDGWSKDIEWEREEAFFSEIKNRLDILIKKMHEINPDLKIIINGYDYPNFVGYSKVIPKYISHYRKTGSPSPQTLNRGILRLAQKMSELADNNTIYYIHHYGLMNYYYGNPRFGLDKNVSTPPNLISPRNDPLAYGVPVVPTSPRALLRVLLYKDPIHLDSKGYLLLARHLMENLLSDLLNEELKK